MNALSLFSGIGAHDLGLERAGFRTVAFCESDPWCRAVLAKHWPGVPCHPDVRRLSGRDVPGPVDIITGGFPCQDISVAGKGEGLDGARSGLWFEYLRLVRELRPAWVLAENVPALRARGFDTVAAGLEAEGYAVWPVVVGAWAVGAPHRRERVWIVGHSASIGLAIERGERGNPREELAATLRAGGEGLADADRRRLEGERIEERAGIEGASGSEPDGRGDDGRQRWPAGRGEPQHEWEPPRLVESRLGRNLARASARLDGFARRNRLRSLGNANPPQAIEAIGRWILNVEAA